jgi:hypothetical protein
MLRTFGNARLAPMPVLIGEGEHAFEADLYLPRRPWGAVIFAASPACEGEAMHAWLEAIFHSDLAVLCPEQNGLQLDQGYDEVWDSEGQLKMLSSASRWLGEESWTSGLVQGLFGSGPMAAPVLRLAAESPPLIQAVVIHEGSADMSEADLEEIEIPSLFIADSSDPLDAELHEAVSQMLHCESRLILLDRALMPPRAAVDWFVDHFNDYYKSPAKISHAARALGMLHGAAMHASH